MPSQTANSSISTALDLAFPLVLAALSLSWLLITEQPGVPLAISQVLGFHLCKIDPGILHQLLGAMAHVRYSRAGGSSEPISGRCCLLSSQYYLPL